jgi:hypothetical protein
MRQTLFALPPGLKLMTSNLIPRIRKPITQEQYDVIKILCPLLGREPFYYGNLDESVD